MQIDKRLEAFYAKQNEDERLTSQSGRIEFIVTTHYIDKYLKQGDRILEVGAATGRYSLHYARKGYQVDAVELVKGNLDVLEQHIQPGDRITARQGNALDLSVYEDETFDIVLVLGPMYHLFTEKDKLQCLSEAHRVAKKGGIVFVAYCQFDSAMIHAAFDRGMYDFVLENKLLDEERLVPIPNPDNVIDVCRKQDVDRLDEHFNWTRLHYVGTDMFTHYFPQKVDGFDEKMYNRYVRYTLSVCENKELVGVSDHSLDVLAVDRD